MKSVTHSLYRVLGDWLDRSWCHRQLAYYSAGWASLVGLSPDLPPPPARRLRDVVLACLVLVIGLLFLSHFLRAAQPALHAMGSLTGGLTLEFAVLCVGLILNIWRYLAGRKLMLEFKKGISV